MNVAIRLNEMVTSVAGLVDRDVAYVSNEVRIPFATHTDAVGAVRFVRDVLRSARATITAPQTNEWMALKEALDAIEEHARNGFGMERSLSMQEDFEADWADEDREDYERWVRLKAVLRAGEKA